jgi:uncharacterized protein YhbP (UPF0306 family)
MINIGFHFIWITADETRHAEMRRTDTATGVAWREKEKIEKGIDYANMIIRPAMPDALILPV